MDTDRTEEEIGEEQDFIRRLYSAAHSLSCDDPDCPWAAFLNQPSNVDTLLHNDALILVLLGIIDNIGDCLDLIRILVASRSDISRAEPLTRATASRTSASSGTHFHSRRGDMTIGPVTSLGNHPSPVCTMISGLGHPQSRHRRAPPAATDARGASVVHRRPRQLPEAQIQRPPPAGLPPPTIKRKRVVATNTLVAGSLPGLTARTTLTSELWKPARRSSEWDQESTWLKPGDRRAEGANCQCAALDVLVASHLVDAHTCRCCD